MKFESARAFGKHLREASPDHFSPVYLVMIYDPYERKKVGKGVVAALKKGKEGATPLFTSLEERTLAQLIDELNTPSLFGEQKIVFYDCVDKVGKENLGALLAYLKSPSPHAFLVLGAAKSAPVAELVEKGKKEIIILDLTKEKPWDKKKRYVEWLQTFAKMRQKVLPEAICTLLFEEVGDDYALLEQELSKLILYVGERVEITKEDVATVCCTGAKEQLWKVAEKLVWEKSTTVLGTIENASDLFVLITQVRAQLQRGLGLHEGAEFPRLYPKTLEKYKNALRHLPKEYFQRGLVALFDCELLAKNSALSAAFLWDHLCCKLMSNDYPISASKESRK